MSSFIIPIRGMHCKSCELLIEQNLKKITGIKKVDVSHTTGKARIEYEGEKPDDLSVLSAVKEAGYDIGEKNKLPWISKDAGDYKNLFKAAVILLILYIIAKWFGLFQLDVNTESTSLLVVVLVGLVAGVSTCMALVGGLVLGLSARHNERHPESFAKEKFRPHIFFNIGRIAGFAVLGGLIGLLGSAFKLSPNVLGIMTVFVGGVMIFLGLKLVEIFPALKDKSISLPKSISKLFGIDKDNREYSHNGAIITGALTFFLPCGFTQAMQLYAVSTGSFIQGALIMSLFALGTAPGLFGIGGLSAIFKGAKARLFYATAGLLVIILGWFNIANGSHLVSTKKDIVASSDKSNNTTNQDVQIVDMTQGSSGYKPNVLTIKKGVPVKWVITSTNPYSCASSIVVPKYGISKYLEKGENIIEFTPNATGEIPFSCSMGMYRGKFIVE
ncbi:MAG: sulfite exporter TauE/SafE family protein [Candidatus Magasanikbacteria bacterium]